MSINLLHPKDMKRVIREKRAILVDLREKTDYRSYHYPNAWNIPYQENECWLQNFQRGKVYILYCEHGNVSLMAAKRLSCYGIEVYSIIGGMEGLKRLYFYD